MNQQFDYFFRDRKVFLQIPRIKVEQKDSNFFIDFLNFGIKSQDLHVADLYNKVVIEFSGYEKDNREVYEIPEIKAWCQKLSEEFNGLFFFLNMDLEPSTNSYQPTVLMPMFIKFQKAQNHGISYNRGDFIEYFMRKQTELIFSFAQAQNMNGQHYGDLNIERMKKILNHL